MPGMNGIEVLRAIRQTDKDLRKEDIAALANHFLRRFSLEMNKNFVAIADDALEKLLAYECPGNVRELANIIERAIVLGDGPQLTLHHLPPVCSARSPRMFRKTCPTMTPSIATGAN
jgi:DNA-binding NtrC family response regulator